MSYRCHMEKTMLGTLPEITLITSPKPPFPTTSNSSNSVLSREVLCTLAEMADGPPCVPYCWPEVVGTAPSAASKGLSESSRLHHQIKSINCHGIDSTIVVCATLQPKVCCIWCEETSGIVRLIEKSFSKNSVYIQIHKSNNQCYSALFMKLIPCKS